MIIGATSVRLIEFCFVGLNSGLHSAPSHCSSVHTIACYMNGCVALMLTLCVIYACCVTIGRPITGACIYCSPHRQDNVGRTIYVHCFLLCCLIKVIKQINCYKFGTIPQRGQFQNAYMRSQIAPHKFKFKYFISRMRTGGCYNLRRGAVSERDTGLPNSRVMWYFVSWGSVIGLFSSFMVLYSRPLHLLALFSSLPCDVFFFLLFLLGLVVCCLLCLLLLLWLLSWVSFGSPYIWHCFSIS